MLGTQLTYVDTTHAPPVVVVATINLTQLLDGFPGYFLLIDRDGQVLYKSPSVRVLPRLTATGKPQTDEADSLTTDQAESLRLAAVRLAVEPPPILARIVRGPHDSTRVALVERGGGGGLGNPYLSHVVVGFPADIADLPVELLIGSTLLIVPVVFLLSLIAAHAALGGVFTPVDEMINEVEAISDGRSLHRRLLIDRSNDPLSRLSGTLNAMLERLELSFGGLRRFTADASHELKTPLTVMRADVERAMHPNTRATDRMVALEEALQEVARMTDLVESLLTLARADEGRFDLVRDPVEPVRPLLHDVFETQIILGRRPDCTL